MKFYPSWYVNKVYSTDKGHNLLQYTLKLAVFNDKVNMKERKAGKTKMLHKAAPLSVNRKNNIRLNDLLHQKQVSPLNFVFVKSWGMTATSGLSRAVVWHATGGLWLYPLCPKMQLAIEVKHFPISPPETAINKVVIKQDMAGLFPDNDSNVP